MNYTQSGAGTTGQNYLALIAVEDNTDLLLHKKDGSTLNINLAKAGDVYEYISTNKEDYTGVFVEVDPSKSLCKTFCRIFGSHNNYHWSLCWVKRSFASATLFGK